MKKVGHTSEFLFAIYWWTWKTNNYLKNCWSGPIKNKIILIFRPCQINFLFNVYPHAYKKTRHIEPFCLKMSVSILFIYYMWKTKHFSYISILIIFFLNKQQQALQWSSEFNSSILFKMSITAHVKWNVSNSFGRHVWDFLWKL